MGARSTNAERRRRSAVGHLAGSCGARKQHVMGGSGSAVRPKWACSGCHKTEDTRAVVRKRYDGSKVVANRESTPAEPTMVTYALRPPPIQPAPPAVE